MKRLRAVSEVFPDLHRSRGGTMLELIRTVESLLALRSNRAVTAIEYGLITALISVAIIAAVTLVGTQLTATFNMLAGHLGSSPH